MKKCKGNMRLCLPFHRRFPPAHMEPGLILPHHPDWAPELHGGKGPRPGQCTDFELHENAIGYTEFSL